MLYYATQTTLVCICSQGEWIGLKQQFLNIDQSSDCPNVVLQRRKKYSFARCVTYLFYLIKACFHTVIVSHLKSPEALEFSALFSSHYTRMPCSFLRICHFFETDNMHRTSASNL